MNRLWLGILAGVALAVAAENSSGQTPTSARGPLRTYSTNPRYFTDGSGRAV
jgi:hypothetical protein